MGAHEVTLPEFLDNRHVKVARLSALRIGRFYPQEITLVKSKKNPNYPIGILFLSSLVLCTSSVLDSLSWLSFILAFVFTYKTQHRHPYPGENFYSLFALYSYFFVLVALAFAFCPYSTTHTTQISMPSAKFEPAIPESEWPQTYTLDRAATGIGRKWTRDLPACSALRRPAPQNIRVLVAKWHRHSEHSSFARPWSRILL